MFMFNAINEQILSHKIIVNTQIVNCNHVKVVGKKASNNIIIDIIIWGYSPIKNFLNAGINYNLIFRPLDRYYIIKKFLVSNKFGILFEAITPWIVFMCCPHEIQPLKVITCYPI